MKSEAPRDMEKGEQPLEKILTECGIRSSDLVKASTDQLTHKMVAKGRKGRRLTLNAQLKILKALNACQSEKKYNLPDLFNYQAS